MKNFFIVLAIVLAVLSSVLVWVSYQWERANEKASSDRYRLVKLIERPDLLHMRLTEDLSLTNAVLWDRSGNIMHPSEEKFVHPIYILHTNELRRLHRVQQSAKHPLWMNFDAEGDILMHCTPSPPACLLYDRKALQQVLSVPYLSAVTSQYGFLWRYTLVSAILSILIAIICFKREYTRTEAAFSIFPDSHRAQHGDLQVTLTPKDLRLLMLLKERQGDVVTKDELYDAGWGRDYMPNSRALDQHILNLRQKLDPDKSRPQLIETVHGVGYRLCN